MARKIQEEWEAKEERNIIAEEKAANEALIRNFDDIKARIEADRLLAEKLQEQEREQFTIEERAEFLHDTIAAQRKFLAQQRSEAIRNRPPTKNQLRNQMMTYLKHIDQRMNGERSLIPLKSDSIQGRKVKKKFRRKLRDGGKKRSNGFEITDRKYPIKEWKTECLGTKPQTDQAEDFEEINQNVVIRKFQDEIPEGFDRVLWGDLMVMFNPDDENEFWNSQLDWIIVSWKLHSSSGVHTLVTETGLIIHMLVEKKYPLRKEVLVQMLKLKLESEEDSTMALELIRHKNWLVHKQTACGKDFSNPFMVDNLPKIVGLSTHLASVVKSWLVHDQTVHALASPKANELTIPEQTATGKGTSNPLMAGPFEYKVVTFPRNEATRRQAETRMQTFKDLTPEEKIRKECDIQASNIILHGLLNDIYTLLNHKKDAYDIWYRVKELIEEIQLTKQERESKLANEFDIFTSEKGETIQSYYMRFVTEVKQAKNLHKVSFDQLYAYLKQNEPDANEFRAMKDRFPDPLVIIANTYNLPPSCSSYKSQYNPPMLVVAQQQPYIPQPSYEPPVVYQQPSAIYQQPPDRPTSPDSGFAVPSFLPTDDIIAKAWIEIDAEQQDFLADRLEGFDSDCDDLQLNTTSILMTEKVDAYDSEVDDAPTASKIFMAKLSPVGSINGDEVGS
ncbi:hypothetical protein Tco_0733599, partial [Tanacetum coccineum]